MAALAIQEGRHRLAAALDQLVGLERRTARGGRDSIDHPPGGHDDLANAVAGALLLASRPVGYDDSMDWVGGFDDVGSVLYSH